MKTFLLALVASFLFPFLSESVSASNGEGSVYVCNSKQAKAYHSNYDCRGLNRCKYDPDCVSLSEAERRVLRACRICY